MCLGVEGERPGDRSPDSLGVGASGMNLSRDTDSRTARRMLLLSLPQKASMRGNSPATPMLASSGGLTPSSGELGPRLRSRGALVVLGGGEDTRGL